MKNLYVGNLPHSTTEGELRSAFEAHGAVEKVSIVTDRDTGRSRGFGFVEMTNAAEAETLLDLLAERGLGGRITVYPSPIVALDDGAGAPSETYGRSRPATRTTRSCSTPSPSVRMRPRSRSPRGGRPSA